MGNALGLPGETVNYGQGQQLGVPMYSVLGYPNMTPYVMAPQMVPQPQGGLQGIYPQPYLNQGGAEGNHPQQPHQNPGGAGGNPPHYPKYPQ